MIPLDLQWSVPAAVESSPHVCQVAAMFGLRLDVTQTLILIPPPVWNSTLVTSCLSPVPPVPARVLYCV